MSEEPSTSSASNFSRKKGPQLRSSTRKSGANVSEESSGMSSPKGVLTLQHSIKEKYRKWNPDDINIFLVFIIIIKVGGLVLRNILQVAVSKSPGETLEELLQKKKKYIKSNKRFLHKDMFRKLFPAEGKTDVDGWDITLLSFVLLYVIDGLPEDIVQGIREIREMKNKKVSHTNLTNIDEKQFKEFCDNFERILKTLSPYLEEKDRQTLQNLFSRYKQNECPIVIEELATDAECPEEIKSFIISYQTERNDAIDKLNSIVETADQTGTCVLVPLLIKVSCPDNEKRENATGALKKAMEDAIEMIHENIRRECIELCIELLQLIKLNNVELKSIKGESIVLYVQCSTLSAVLTVLDAFISEDSDEILRKISKALKDIFDADIEVQAVPMKLVQLQSLVSEIEKQTADEKIVTVKEERKRKKKTPKAGLKIPRTQEDTSGAVMDLNAKLQPVPCFPRAGLKIPRTQEDTSGAVMDLNAKLQSVPCFPRVVCDPIHGHIELSPLCGMFVDTPQFQRLRYIKQLGNCYFVYPGASHNRFEHSLGTCHLAKQLVRALRSRQPELKLDDKDELCIEIAALCHDLGHGPFSHPFEQHFIRQINRSWKHQMASVEMFDHLIQANNLQPILKQFGIGEEDILFIKKLIMPPKGQMTHFDGKEEEKSYMYEIISNEFNGIDVDKWDYFARDCHMSGIKNSFDHVRCIHFARVIKCPDGRNHICFRDKEASDLYEMYHTRSRLHRWLYQHKVCNTLNYMITDALMLAKSHLIYIGKDGNVLELPDTIHDMTAYTKVNDDVFSKILNLESKDPNVIKAKQILEDILSRRLYEMVTKKQLKFRYFSLDDALKAKKELLRHYLRVRKEQEDNGESFDIPELTEDDIIMDPVNFDFGKGEENPIDFVWFYSKSNISEARRIPKEQVSFMLPITFAEQQLRLFCKVKDKTVTKLLKDAFSYWCYDKELPGPN